MLMGLSYNKMRSVLARFEMSKRKNPYYADYMHLLNAVRGQNFTRAMISRWLTEMVPEEEYGRKNRETLIDQLVECSKNT